MFVFFLGGGGVRVWVFSDFLWGLLVLFVVCFLLSLFCLCVFCFRVGLERENGSKKSFFLGFSSLQETKFIHIVFLMYLDFFKKPSTNLFGGGG